MDWNAAAGVLTATKVPEQYTLSQLGHADVPAVADRIRHWYPDVSVGMESPHLDEAFWYTQTALVGESAERAILPIVAKHVEQGVVGVITYQMESLGRTITCRLGVIDPAHRSAGLAFLGPILLEKLGQAIGAELAYYFATLKTRHQQVIAERMGYRLVGIMPAYDRDMIAAGEIKRVYEAIYAKVLVDAADVCVPADEVFTPQTRAVWQALFGAQAR